MRRLICVMMVAGLSVVGGVAKADDTADMNAAAQKVSSVISDVDRLYAQGDFDGSMKLLLGAFPEATRTPMQMVMLGNLVRKNDPKMAYELHKQAALAAPENPGAVFEWAIDQHRAKEWAGAIASYEAFDKLSPGFAPAYGLWAQCLLEQGKAKEACAMWRRSEGPKTHGSLQEFQRLVCEANWQVSPFRARAELFNKARKGDLDAARKLITLDSNFPSNWWSQGPVPAYLAGDLEMLARTTFTDKEKIREIIDAGEVAQASVRRRVNMADFLKEEGYLFDAKGTLPKDPGALGVMVNVAIVRQTLTREEAIDAWGPVVLEAGKASKDPDLLLVAANIYAGTEERTKIDQYGWDNTQDERFASSLIAMLYVKGELRLEDPRLARAIEDYPRNAQIAGVRVALMMGEQKPTEQGLVAALKAEYSRLSIAGPEMEPTSRALIAYFHALDALLKQKTKA
jgi:tetratricopeptide (TPR) repeat protein